MLYYFYVIFDCEKLIKNKGSISAGFPFHPRYFSVQCPFYQAMPCDTLEIKIRALFRKSYVGFGNELGAVCSPVHVCRTRHFKRTLVLKGNIFYTHL